jgi:hypothetical protein
VALSSVNTGRLNTGIGTDAGSAITSGSRNVVIGGYTGSAAPISATGSNWIVLSDGVGTVRQVIDSSGNTGFGNTAPTAKVDITGTLKASGVSTFQNLTVGLGPGAVATNTVVGVQAAYTNSTGSDNTIVGYQAAFFNASGVSLTAVGTQAGLNTTGNYNTFIGTYAGLTNTSGSNNTFVGQASGYLTTGGYNTFVGQGAGYTTNSGVQNSFFGYLSGYSVTTGSKNVILGSYSGSTAPISGTGSNWIVLSDGDGTVRQAIDSAGNSQILTGASVVYAPAPASFSGLATLTNANLQTQIIVTTGTNFTLTMPLGSDLDTLITWAGVDLGYDFSLINTASGTITLAASTGVSIVGRATVLTVVTGRFRIRRTAASTYIVYRIG